MNPTTTPSADDPAPQRAADHAPQRADGPAPQRAADHALQRDKERTRAAILEAALRMMAEHGTGVSLAAIAEDAGVSKGALTHHFRSRNALEEALVHDVNDRFRAEVLAHVDLTENRPGKLLRAYVRTLASDSAAAREIFSPSSLLLQLGSRPFVEASMQEDARRWREALSADGLDEATVVVVRLGAEGVASSLGSPYLTDRELDLARERLLALTEPA
ncbi:TetR/AcrR family transcriptional regulator [Brachybacterium aquaticum]|uniref:AcrR family transcriptional regulator n=1 Tax=Brachybacterium aquaticum TaxID=1432564 RepID=A0A841A8H6_9MICO|nr:TetR/AcrR family transcriptional regulator [Brachybacterium aquaticum]MBB5830233.1 AcrR family transcriptional regulator [Brachybacterium aquaticum]